LVTHNETRRNQEYVPPVLHTFLDGLAELIADAIRDEAAEGTTVAPENASDNCIVSIEDL
jgi:hypothetical protein